MSPTKKSVIQRGGVLNDHEKERSKRAGKWNFDVIDWLIGN
jgi:hypothetical protein